PPALGVDRLAHCGGDEARRQQTDSEPREDEAAAPARVLGDRTGQDAERVECRAPSDDLRDTQRDDGRADRRYEPDYPGPLRWPTFDALRHASLLSSRIGSRVTLASRRQAR